MALTDRISEGITQSERKPDSTRTIEFVTEEGRATLKRIKNKIYYTSSKPDPPKLPTPERNTIPEYIELYPEQNTTPDRISDKLPPECWRY